MYFSLIQKLFYYLKLLNTYFCFLHNVTLSRSYNSVANYLLRKRNISEKTIVKNFIKEVLEYVYGYVRLSVLIHKKENKSAYKIF